MDGYKKLRRSIKDRTIAGVCGGVADFLGLSSSSVRVAFVIFAIFGGFGLLLYLGLWFIVPQQSLTDI